MNPVDEIKLRNFIARSTGFSESAWSMYARLRALGASHDRARQSMRAIPIYRQIHGNTWNAAERHWNAYSAWLEMHDQQGSLQEYHRQRMEDRREEARRTRGDDVDNEDFYTRQGRADEFMRDETWRVTWGNPDTAEYETRTVNIVIPPGASDVAIRSYIASYFAREQGRRMSSDDPIWEEMFNATIERV